MTTILFDSAAVKPASRRRFGVGLLAFVLSSGTASYSTADHAWYVEHVAAATADALPSDAELDRLAAESEALDRLTAGCLL
jgi:hypothetical protein